MFVGVADWFAVAGSGSGSSSDSGSDSDFGSAVENSADPGCASCWMFDQLVVYSMTI